MARFGNLTTRDIEQAARAIDLGTPEGLRKRYGFDKERAVKYMVRVSEKLYPSKGILAVAAGEHVRNFSGGKAVTVKVLEALGFEIVETK